MIPLAILGAGGHALSCLEVAESCGKFVVLGFIDQKLTPGTLIEGYPVLGADDQISTLIHRGAQFCLGVGSIQNTQLRRKLASLVCSLGGEVATMISPHAVVSPRAVIGKGSVLFPFAYVGPRVRIGENAIINTAAIVEHDAKVGDFTHISTRGVLNGGAEVEGDVYVGSGAVIHLGVKVCSDVVIGSGSVVVKSIEQPGLYVGIPAKRKSDK